MHNNDHLPDALNTSFQRNCRRGGGVYNQRGHKNPKDSILAFSLGTAWGPGSTAFWRRGRWEGEEEEKAAAAQLE